jgi:hypothetical protein
LEARIPAGLTPAEGRRFGLLVGGAFLLLGAISRWRGHAVAPAVLWTLGGTLMLAGTLIPGRLGPVYRRWMGLALMLSRITTPIFMGLVYFGLFTPMGFIRRLSRTNALVRRNADTYWVAREPGPRRRSDLTRQY